MDVAVYDWATLEMVHAGPTSEKSASLMKNRVILVAKHCKKKKEKEMRRRGLPFIFFPPPWLVFFFITPWTLKQQTQRQKKSELSREDHVSSKVGFLKFCYLLFLANNNENSNPKHRNLFSVKQCCCHCWLSLSLSLSLKQSHHLEQRQRPTFEIWSSI